MSRLYSGEKIVKAFIRAGFSVVSQKGSHVKMRGFRFGKLQTVIVPNHKEIAFGTLQSVLTQASMTFEELKTYIR
ncbi:MAG: type II toxin-antitoxin system HicA family toxin [bacterium]|nr:type II toxin-antitoxin system HicA family toxin [bacterium]